jgi:hypothetical protein
VDVEHADILGGSWRVYALTYNPRAEHHAPGENHISDLTRILECAVCEVGGWRGTVLGGQTKGLRAGRLEGGLSAERLHGGSDRA